MMKIERYVFLCLLFAVPLAVISHFSMLTAMNQSLCINCKQRPKQQGYDFCGLTCAQNYKFSICLQCGLKQKMSGHAFCGKTCAQNYADKFKQSAPLSGQQGVQKQIGQQGIGQAVFTYLNNKGLQLKDVELFYDNEKHQQNYIFCNFYPCDVTVDNTSYKNAEAAFQAGKTYKNGVPQALQFADGDQAFKIGKNGQWSYHGQNVIRMKDVLWAKFTQNNKLKQFLLQTGKKTLIEDSDRDAFWGIGPQGTGQNKLGELLMDLREQLQKNEQQNFSQQRQHSQVNFQQQFQQPHFQPQQNLQQPYQLPQQFSSQQSFQERFSQLQEQLRNREQQLKKQTQELEKKSQHLYQWQENLSNAQNDLLVQENLLKQREYDLEQIALKTESLQQNLEKKIKIWEEKLRYSEDKTELQQLADLLRLLKQKLTQLLSTVIQLKN